MPLYGNVCLLVSGINIYLMGVLPGRLYKKLSAEEIEELEGFSDKFSWSKKCYHISQEKFAKTLADSRFKEIQPLEITYRDYFYLCMQRWK